MAKKTRAARKYQLIKSKRDPFYNSLWLSKFSNHFIKDGKKFIIEKIFFNSFSIFKQRKKRKQKRVRNRLRSRCSNFVKTELELQISVGRREIKSLQKVVPTLLVQKLLKAYLVKIFLLKQLRLLQEQNKPQKIILNKLMLKIDVEQPLYMLLRYFSKHKPLFTLVSKRMGRVFKKIPVPLSIHRQLVVSLRLCAITIKTSFRGSLGNRIYKQLIISSLKKKTFIDREKYKSMKMIADSRTNIRFRWI